MKEGDIIILNFQEVRRRSLILWSGLTPEYYYWKPDIHAMNCIEMVRHVFEGEHLFHKVVENRGNIGDYLSPWKGLPYSNFQDELEFAKPFREKFMDTVKLFSTNDLETIEIIRSERGQRRKLGDYLQRIAYHEAVHAGQMLSYFRTLQLERPHIWD